jgi:electron transfer flavoprotein beta subunit
MEIIVCVKRVPETAEATLAIAEDKKSIREEGLVFDLNEWDNYAIEEAIRLKEKLGGTVTVMTVGKETANEQVRVCLAKGCDTAIRLTDAKFEGSDGFAVARILFSVIKKMKYDLVLTGAQAEDDCFGQTGVNLAELLGLPHAALVTKVEILNEKRGKIVRELEGGLSEVLEISLPAVLTIQTGINEPRYASVMGIRKAMKKEIKIMGLADTGLAETDVGAKGSRTQIEEMFFPPVGKMAEILQGAPEEAAGKLATLLKEKGLA